MAILVDPIFDADGPRGFTRWCHMGSDLADQAGLDELHEMARRIGMRREWFQDKAGHPHYDLVPSRRAAAIRLGAVSVCQQDYALRVSFPRRMDAFRKARVAAVESGDADRILAADRAINRLERLIADETADASSPMSQAIDAALKNPNDANAIDRIIGMAWQATKVPR